MNKAYWIQYSKHTNHLIDKKKQLHLGTCKKQIHKETKYKLSNASIIKMFDKWVNE